MNEQRNSEKQQQQQWVCCIAIKSKMRKIIRWNQLRKESTWQYTRNEMQFNFHAIQTIESIENYKNVCDITWNN